MVSPFKIEAVVKNYLWGVLGESSLVARLAGNYKSDLPYAELWLGGHPQSSSVAKLSSGDLALNDFIKANASDLLGARVATSFLDELPFLFKILSIGEPLSIQAHPSQQLARELHAKDPKNYPDNNHKPEIAIALSQFKLLYGFRSAKELTDLLQKHPELGSFLKSSHSEPAVANGALAKDLYRGLALAESRVLASATDRIATRISAADTLSEQEELFLNLHLKFGPSDLGVITSLLMNFVTLKPFEAIYTAPNILHAYVSGDIVECMASSDNVVRGGLTPKFIDVSTLVDMLDYEASFPALIEASPSSSLEGWQRYSAPVKEFCLEKFCGSMQVEVQQNQELALYFCLSGKVSVSDTLGVDLELLAGESCIVSASTSQYAVEIFDGTVFRVLVP